MRRTIIIILILLIPFVSTALAVAPSQPTNDQYFPQIDIVPATETHVYLVWTHGPTLASVIASDMGMIAGWAFYYKSGITDGWSAYTCFIPFLDTTITNGTMIYANMDLAPVDLLNDTRIPIDGNISVRVVDGDGDPMTVSFYWDNDTLISTHAGVASGSTAYSNQLDLQYNTSYTYYITLDDGGTTTTTPDINFTTTHSPVLPPVISDEYPVNGSVGHRKRPTCHVNVTDYENITVMFYENTTGAWVLRNTQVVTGTEVSWRYSQANKWRTQYWWKVVADDGTDNTTRIYHFNTTHPKPSKEPRIHDKPTLTNQNSPPPEEVPGFELITLLVVFILYIMWQKTIKTKGK